MKHINEYINEYLLTKSKTKTGVDTKFLLKTIKAFLQNDEGSFCGISTEDKFKLLENGIENDIMQKFAEILIKIDEEECIFAVDVIKQHNLMYYFDRNMNTKGINKDSVFYLLACVSRTLIIVLFNMPKHKLYKIFGSNIELQIKEYELNNIVDDYFDAGYVQGTKIYSSKETPLEEADKIINDILK